MTYDGDQVGRGRSRQAVRRRPESGPRKRLSYTPPSLQEFGSLEELTRGFIGQVGDGLGASRPI